MTTLCAYVSDNFLEGSSRLEKLGEGVYGTVYKVKFSSGETYAVKYLPLQNGITQAGLLDADALVRLKGDPDVTKMVGICHASTYLAIIMEPMDSNLHKLITETLLDQRVALFTPFLLTMLRTAALMETLDIFHFDIKPQNILVRRTTEGIRFKVTDFGLSRNSYGPNQFPQIDLFSLWYRPPEFLGERTRTTFKVYTGDIWSIAVTALELLKGVSVICGSHTLGMLKQIKEMWDPHHSVQFRQFQQANCKGDILGRIDSKLLLSREIPIPGALDSIPDYLFEILSDMLTINPDQRPTGVQLLKRLGRALSPVYLSTLVPVPVDHRIDIQGLNIIIETGYALRCSLATLIISIELFTRYLALCLPKADYTTVALTSLRLGIVYNEDVPIDINKMPYQKESAADILRTEQEILKCLKYEVYNLNLSPVINRAYKRGVDLRSYNLELFAESLDRWFS